jgi:probable F420-dependent oxidoreductase
MGHVELGLFGLNMGSCTTPDGITEAAQAAEAAGFDSLWAGEHIVVPDPQVPPSPMAPDDPALDSLTALTWAAAATRTVRLVTGIIILPQRNPVVLAKEITAIDVLSRGRFTLGIGVGYLEPEFRAIGANFAQRGPVTDEFLEAMQHLWYDERPEYHGRFAEFEGVNAHPRPVQRPIPVVIGGRSAAAYRRAVSRGAGWYGFALTPEEAKTCLNGLARAASQVPRPPSLGPLEISVTPRGRLTAETAGEFAALGVHRLVPMPRPRGDGVPSTIEAARAAVAGL